MMHQKEENYMIQIQNMMTQKPIMNKDLVIDVYFHFSEFG